MSRIWWRCVCACAALVFSAPSVQAATIFVAAGGNLQDALNTAQPGDTIVLAENAEFVGNFVLPVKTGDQWITLRSAAPDTVLPADGVRIRPSHAALLARLRSPNTLAALRTAPGAHHWNIRYLEFPANENGYGDILQIGDGSSAQNTLAKVPHHIVLNHVFVHGDPIFGQKRGIALNAAYVTITDSHVADCKGIGQDTQAIGGWNGPGPYTIENNYLEAAGENVLFGGADPAIPNLVADGITFRGNYLSRPMSWRSPIIATPQGVTATAVTGGSLAAGTYAYRVVARRTVGQGTSGRSTASAEVQVTTSATGAVRVRWQAVPGAAEYRVYGRSAGAQATYWRVTGTEYIDTGATGVAENVPTAAGTVWSVKNIFELKNARNVVIQNNILENHWKESQAGYAVVFTPRNSGGTCSWCGVEEVRFESNVVRHVAAGINLLGYDSPEPSRQTTGIVISNNVFYDMSTSYGGNGWFMLVGDEPKNISISHNTVDSNGGALIYAYGGNSTNPREILGLEMVANASRHGSYGVNGQYFSYGNGILNGYFPGAVFSSNYLAGASLSRYPVGTISAGLFPDQFVNPAAGDYTLRSSSALKGGAADGSDVGADFTAVAARTAGVVAGLMANDRPTAPPPTAPTAAFTSACSFLECTFSEGSIPGTQPLTGYSWSFGDGVMASGAVGSHSFAAAGTYTVTLTVSDGGGLSATASASVTVAPPLPPTAGLTVTCIYLQCTFADASSPGSREITSRSWSFGDGSPAVSNVISGGHLFAAAGSYLVTLVAGDATGLSSSASFSVSVEPPNTAPVAAFTAKCVDLVCTFADNSLDSDGRIVAWKWAFATGSATVQAPSFAFPAPGSYTVTLTVTDDDGADAAVAVPVAVTAVLHAAYKGTTVKWWSGSVPTPYWSANVTVTVHGADERPIAGATVAAAWSGAVVKTATCVTNAAGSCTFKSGTLSYGRSTVTLSVAAITAPLSVFNAAASHDQATLLTAFRLVRP
jgi:PKD repeat protein